MRIDLALRLKFQNFYKRTQAKAWALMVPVLASPAFAQVSTVSTTVNSKLNGFLQVVTGVGLTVFTCALAFAGFKFAMVEGTKLHDLKGLLIGGTIFGAAGAIAAYLIS